MYVKHTPHTHIYQYKYTYIHINKYTYVHINIYTYIHNPSFNDLKKSLFPSKESCTISLNLWRSVRRARTNLIGSLAFSGWVTISVPRSSIICFIFRFISIKVEGTRAKRLGGCVWRRGSEFMCVCVFVCVLCVYVCGFV